MAWLWRSPTSPPFLSAALSVSRLVVPVRKVKLSLAKGCLLTAPNLIISKM